RMHRRSTVLFARYGLSLSAYYRGEFEEAGRELEDIASGLRSLGMVIPAIETLWKAAECALIQGDIARFERLADALTEEDLVRGAEVHRAERYTMEGLKAILGGNAQNARSHFAAAMEASETSIHSDRVRPHVVFSAVMDLTGNHEESSQLLRRLRGLLQPLSRKAELSSMEFRHGLLCKSLAKATYR
ncbi:MAG: hypothetical protein GTO63_08750, partial [Anaerolineae bacterium]|nr:hypothetical protein [Anaerolineae bacterium]NIN94976.1 hypothetical protein [Anaerolineae bacterium]